MEKESPAESNDDDDDSLDPKPVVFDDTVDDLESVPETEDDREPGRDPGRDGIGIVFCSIYCPLNFRLERPRCCCRIPLESLWSIFIGSVTLMVRILTV